MLTDDLLGRWTALVGGSETASAAGRDVLDRWSEPHRRYHDLGHLAHVLDRLDELEPAVAAPDRTAVRLAAFFHDVVYDPLSVANEAASGELASTVLTSLELPPELVVEVRRLVQITASHEPNSPADLNAALLCDADLAVLASDPETYARYASDVRAEYGHFSDDVFAAGRAAVLVRLLGRDAMFATEAGRERWEERARHNVAAELTLLRSSLSSPVSSSAAGDADRPHATD